MEFSTDEQSLLFVGIGYIFILAVWLWTRIVKGNVLMRELSEKIEPSLWNELGAPASMKETINDPDKRWTKFLKSGAYRERCSAEVADMIDDYKRRQIWMLVVIAISGALIIYRYWPILGSQFL